LNEYYGDGAIDDAWFVCEHVVYVDGDEYYYLVDDDGHVDGYHVYCGGVCYGGIY